MTSTEALPQPHEGVVGIRRDGDPFVESLQAKTTVADLTYQLFMMTLCANPAPKHEQLRERMFARRPGDLVVVRDAIYRGSEDDHWKGVGYLVALRREWWTSDKEWERAKAEGVVDADELRLVESGAVYIQYGPEPVDICRWVNCDLLAVPVEEA